MSYPATGETAGLRGPAWGKSMPLVLLILKNLRRNRRRSLLTGLGILVLTAVFSLVATVLHTLGQAMEAKAADVTIVITERHRFPSRFDRRHLEQIVRPGSALHARLSLVPGFHADRHTLWHFIGFTADPAMANKDLEFFVIATLPEKIPTMIDGMEGLDPKLTELMQRPPRSRRANTGLLMGPERLAQLNKKVGDVFQARSTSHREGTGARRPIEMEFEIVGQLPASSRWAPGAFMDYAYLDRVLKEAKSERDGTINLGWLKLDDADSARQVGRLIEQHIPELKCETAAAAASRFLEPYQGLLQGIKFVLVPAIVVAMALLVANATGLAVRERTTELAVLKVLGYRAGHLLILVLGEEVVLGGLGGLLGAGVTYGLVNQLAGGLKVPVGFFPVFFVPAQVFGWGPVLGVAAAALGGIIPAWVAGRVQVAKVFAQVA